MNQELLPLFAVLTGNDYGTPKDADTLFAVLDLSAFRGGGGRGRGRAPSSRIEGLLLWLSSFPSPVEALEEVSRLIGETGSRGKRGQKGGLSSQLWAVMQEYHITPQSSLAYWFSGGQVLPGGQTSTLAQLPQCLSWAAAQGLLAPSVVDALVMRRVLLMPQVENSKLPSSHCSAIAIRQAIYGILLLGGQGNITQGRGGSIQGPGGAVHPQHVRTEEHISQEMRGGRGRGGRGRGGRGQGNVSPLQQGENVGFSIEEAAGVATVQSQGSSATMCVE